MNKIIHNSVKLNTSFFLIDKLLVFKVQIEVLYTCIIAYIFAIFFFTQTNISLEGVGLLINTLLIIKKNQFTGLYVWNLCCSQNISTYTSWEQEPCHVIPAWISKCVIKTWMLNIDFDVLISWLLVKRQWDLRSLKSSKTEF